MKSKSTDLNRLSKQEEKNLKAVKKYGYAIQHISNPSEAVQLEAVKQNGDAIYYILKKHIWPSGSVMVAAVKQDQGAVKWIANPGLVWK